MPYLAISVTNTYKELDVIKANVLGVEYEITLANETDRPERFDDRDGEVDESVKKIYVNDHSDCVDDVHSLDDKEYLTKKNVRHELIHAFLFESGLAENSNWARNEEMVDWIARQFPKMVKTFEEVKAL